MSGTSDQSSLAPKWMENIIPNSSKPLDTVFPGTHNSATSAIRSFTNPVARWTRCQNLSVTAQLNMGVRLLDIRIADDVRYRRLNEARKSFRPSAQNLRRWSSEEIYITHRFRSCLLRPVLEEVARFLQENTGEIVLLRIERDYDRNLSPMGLASFAWLLEDVFGSGAVINRLEIPDITVGQMRKQNRRIILTAKDAFVDELLELSKVTDVASLDNPVPTAVRGPVLDSRQPVACSYEDPSAVVTQEITNSLQTYDEATVNRDWSPVNANGKLKDYADWLLARLIPAVPSWKWTRGQKAEQVRDKAIRFVKTPELRRIQESGKLFILEVILTHELADIRRYPFSSIESKNVTLSKEHMPSILDLIQQNGNIRAVSCDFVTDAFCKGIAETNRKLCEKVRAAEGSSNILSVAEGDKSSCETRSSDSMINLR